MVKKKRDALLVSIQKVITVDDGLLSISLSPDGLFIIAGGYRGIVYMWDAQTGLLVKQLYGHTDQINSVVYSPDGTLILSGSDDKTIRLWDVKTGMLIRVCASERLVQSGKVHCVVFFSDGLVFGSLSRLVSLWDTQTGSLLHTFKPSAVDSMGKKLFFSFDNKLIASGHCVWDIETESLVETFVSGHELIAYSSSSDCSAYRVRSGTIALYTTTSMLISTVNIDRDCYVRSALFSPDGSLMVTTAGLSETIMEIWSVKTGTLLYTIPDSTSTDFTVAFSPDGRSLVSFNWDDNRIIVYNIAEIAALVASN